jgi:hypothetical protein
MTEKQPTWAQRWDAYTRRHPWLLWLLVLALAFLTGPLMIGGSSVTAVLYKDF